MSFFIELFCVVTLQYQILVRIAIAYFIIEKKESCATALAGHRAAILFNLNLKGDITMKEYQHLIGKIIIATAIIVATIIIAGAIDRAGANIQSGLGYLRDALLR